jgi:hypothetical protein
MHFLFQLHAQLSFLQNGEMDLEGTKFLMFVEYCTILVDHFFSSYTKTSLQKAFHWANQ